LNKAIIVDSLDNVATTITKLEAGSMVTFKFGSKKKVKLKQSIPFGHKFALKKIKKGEKIIKYGEVIGRATQSIEEGDHVHIHNVESMRGRGDIE
jgi:altronate dehydratase small subunit